MRKGANIDNVGKMSPRLGPILLVLLAWQGVRAQAPPDERGRPKEARKGIWEIDHLVPIDPHDDHPVHRRYRELRHKLLQVPGREKKAAVMVYAPSFDPEECLYLYKKEGEGARYTLVHTRADRNIWYSMPENRDEGEPGKGPEPVKVTRHETSLTPDPGGRVSALWEQMLAGVRYPGPEFDGSGIDDATVVEFRCARGEFGRTMYGVARSPSRGAPKRLLDLGRSLIDYASADEAERPRLRKVVEERCQALEDDLAKKTGR